jgi:hypothetical protein
VSRTGLNTEHIWWEEVDERVQEEKIHEQKCKLASALPSAGKMKLKQARAIKTTLCSFCDKRREERSTMEIETRRLCKREWKAK